MIVNTMIIYIYIYIYICVRCVHQTFLIDIVITVYKITYLSSISFTYYVNR